MDEAEGWLRSAVRLSSIMTDANVVLGAKFPRKRATSEEAEDCLQRAISLDPNSADAYINMGIVKVAANLPAVAEACFRKAIQLNPDNPIACHNLGSSERCQPAR